MSRGDIEIETARIAQIEWHEWEGGDDQTSAAAGIDGNHSLCRVAVGRLRLDIWSYEDPIRLWGSSGLRRARSASRLSQRTRLFRLDSR
jgi:hypothetical protein